MNDAYCWPLRVATDYAGDRISISEGSIQHIKEHHPDDSSEVNVDRVEQVLVNPAGGVYRNHPDHKHPERLNYYSAPVDTEYGKTYTQLVVDKVVDPAKVISGWSTDSIGNHGECIYIGTTEEER